MELFRRQRDQLHLLLEHRNFSRRLELDFLLDQMERRLGVHAGAVGLDIACGLGTDTSDLAGRLAARMVGVDHDLEVVRQARRARRPGMLDFFVGDSHALPFAGGTFDFATSVCAFEHFADDRRAFDEAARVLRPGGWFFLTVDSLDHPAVTDDYRARHRAACRVHQYYTSDGLRRRLEAAGFEVAAIAPLVRGHLASRLSRLGLRTGFGKTYLMLSAILQPFVRAGERRATGGRGYKLGAAARRRDATRSS